jgi:hypothetical protein
MIRKKATGNYDTGQCKKRTIKRTAFKGTIALLQLKNIGIKTSKEKRPMY